MPPTKDLLHPHLGLFRKEATLKMIGMPWFPSKPRIKGWPTRYASPDVPRSRTEPKQGAYPHLPGLQALQALAVVDAEKGEEKEKEKEKAWRGRVRGTRTSTFRTQKREWEGGGCLGV